MPTVDLKASRDARLAALKGDPPKVNFPDGKLVELPLEPSIGVAETLMHLAELDPEDTTGKSMKLMVQLGRDILGDKLYKQFVAAGATLQDLMELGAKFGELYPFGPSLGGIAGLGRLVLGRFESVEADFQRFYGIDLSDALWGPQPMSLRRLKVLVTKLPREAMTVVDELGPAEARWDQDTELLATIVDVQQWILHVLVKANFEGNPRPPDPFPRPGAPAPERKTVSTAHLEAVLKVQGR